MISKIDFLLFMETPMHLWAKKHEQLTGMLSDFDQHLMLQGQEIEQIAREYLTDLLSGQGLEVESEVTLLDGDFQARIDVLARDPNSGEVDLYEIKSSMSIKPEHKYDIAFQTLVGEASLSIRDVFLVIVNKEYVLQDELAPADFFVIIPANEWVQTLRAEVLESRAESLRVSVLSSPVGVTDCPKPATCPCPELCHPVVPEFSIYDIPRLNAGKARELKEAELLAIEDLPADYPLSAKQQQVADVLRTRTRWVDVDVLRGELDALVYPLYFLDYETYNAGVPQWPGYGPYQHLVFQYSLHIIDRPDAPMRHEEFVSLGRGDPSRDLAENLLPKLGTQGSVLVWNRGFEASRNKEMGARYPEYRAQFDEINERMVDLMLIVSNGVVVDPGFHGRWSIKKVLPVLVPGYKDAYEALDIGRGDQAMLAWWQMVGGAGENVETGDTLSALLAYCELDTLAMVEIWKAFRQMV